MALPAVPLAAVGGAQLPPLKIPSSPTSEVAVRGPSHNRSQLAVITSIVLVVMVALEFVTDPDEAREWSFWIVTLVFPSKQITWIKIVCVTLGLCLSTSYFLGSQEQLASAEHIMVHSAQALVSPFSRSRLKAATASNSTPTGTTTASWLASRCQSLLRTNHFGDDGGTDHHDEIPQLKIRDECKALDTPVPLSATSEFEMVNSKQPLVFESEYFAGHALIMVRNTSAKPDATSNWGHLFGSKRRTLWVQIQGRFRKVPPSRSALFVVTELPHPDGFQVAFLTKQLVSLLITLVKKFVPTAHIAFGDKRPDPSDHELPHAAFPLYQTVDEFVVSDGVAPPLLGQESFGETVEQKKARATTPIGKEPPIRMDAVYTFQFHTMYADFAQWKIVNVPGMPDMDLTRFCGPQPIRLAAYSVSVPVNHAAILPTLPHKAKDKQYLYCFSLHQRPVVPTNPSTTQSPPTVATNETKTTVRPPTIPSQDNAVPAVALNGAQRALNHANRWRSVSCDQLPALTRAQEVTATSDSLSESDAPSIPIQPRIRASSIVRRMSPLERAQDLTNWSFALPFWIERVDAAAGNRKVGYLFTVEEKARPQGHCRRRRRCVIRSAATVRSALLSLDADARSTSAELKKLSIESREFQYTAITRETDLLARRLQEIAAIPATQAAASDSDRDKMAMLYNCLMSEAQLPCIRSFHEIGVQLSRAKRDQMDIILERGGYRIITTRGDGTFGTATPLAPMMTIPTETKLLRQEWFIVTTTEVLFFRSFTLRPSKTVSIAQILSVQGVDSLPFLDDDADVEERSARMTTSSSSSNLSSAASSSMSVPSAPRATNRWFCLQLHLLNEVVTVFVDNASDRALWIQSLNQLIKLRATPLVTSPTAALTGSLRLPPLATVEALTTPVCLNHRNPLGSHDTAAPSSASRLSSIAHGGQLVEQILTRGLAVYNTPRHEIKAGALLAFLEGIECLNALNLHAIQEGDDETENKEVWRMTCDEDKVAFALNLYHVLWIHAWIIYGDVMTHAQWRKIKTMPCYMIGNGPSAVRLTLAEIEYGILRGKPASSDEGVLVGKRVESQLPAQLIPATRDFRTSLVLQLNCATVNSTTRERHLIKVYHATTLTGADSTGSLLLDQELEQTCAQFLAQEVSIDSATRVITLPKICEWNAEDYDTTTPVLAGSKAFFCLQKLLPLMHREQQEHIQHLLLGAGKEAQIKYGRFWTQSGATMTPLAASMMPTIASTGTTTVAANSAVDESQTDTRSPTASAHIGDTKGTIRRTNSGALQFIQSLFQSSEGGGGR